MTQRFFSLLLLFAMIFTAGCSDDELDRLREDQKALEQRVAALELWQQQVNDNIAALQNLVNLLDGRDYVTGVTPLSDGSGYIISFYYNGAVIIKNGIDGVDGLNGADGADGKDGADGADGADGYTPVIGVKLASDGNYYWTIDGEWLYDADGNKIRANGQDGKDGADGKDGEDYVLTNEDKQEIAEMAAELVDVPDSGGNVNFQTNETLTLKDGILSVNTTNNMEQDNTLPITSAGVFATVGNIEALLKTI